MPAPLQTVLFDQDSQDEQQRYILSEVIIDYVILLALKTFSSTKYC
jgi:hypothetical protein